MKLKALVVALGVVFVAGLAILFFVPAPASQNGGEVVPPSGKYADLIQVDAPVANAVVSSPLTITGKARGTWYFEASFPVRLLDANGGELAVVPAQAQGDWMTENFVPFKATLAFGESTTKTGTLILQNDNPSGLPENSKEIQIPVQFSDYIETKTAEFDKAVAVSVKDKIIFPGGLILSLRQINDSRCKKDVVCIWAGELSAVFEASGGRLKISSQEITLGTVNNKSVISGGYIFSLEGATENSATIVVSSAPAANISGGITGYLHLGPICPVERIPPDPNCADKPFADALVNFFVKDRGAFAGSTSTDASGNFRVNLVPGTYIVTAGPKKSSFLPSCPQTEATVIAAKFTSVDISCDTGIR